MIDTKHTFTELLKSVENIPKISELSDSKCFDFKISSKKEVLYPLIEKNDVIVVAGAFFGDEGKGKTVDAVASHKDIKFVARVNSGENAGHTVYHEGTKFVFHLAPSGLFSGCENGIGQNCVMDPVTFMDNEISQLIEKNIDYSNLIIGNVLIVTPYSKIIDALGSANSSTLKGMSPSHSSKVRKKGLRLDDLFYPREHQEKIIRSEIEFYESFLLKKNISEEDLIRRFEEMNKNIKRIPDHLIDFLKAKDKVDFIIDLYQKVVVNNPSFPKRGNVTRKIQEILKAGGKVLLEGPQSFFLSNQVETHWRSSTSADTTSAGIKSATGFNLEKYNSLTINVHKTPASSRVGLGANPSGFVPQDFFSHQKINTLKDLEGVCENFDEIQKLFFNSIGDNGILRDVDYTDADGSVYPISVAMAIASSKHYDEKGATTLKPRITGLFDCVAHHFTNESQGPYLTISALDRADDLDEIGLVIAYVVSNPDNKILVSNGKTYSHGDIILPGELPSENVLYHCVPIIKVLPSWKNNKIFSSNKLSELPVEVKQFLSEIKTRTGAEIISIGNGPNRSDLIYLK